MALKPIPIEIIKHYDPALNSEKELIEAIYTNNSIKKTGDIIGYSYNFIYNRLRKYNIKTRKQGEQVENDRNANITKRFLDIPSEKLAEMSQKEIAEEIGCSRAYVSSLIAKHYKIFKSNRLKKGEKHARNNAKKTITK